MKNLIYFRFYIIYYFSPPPLFVRRTSVGIHERVTVSVTMNENKVRGLIMDCVTVPGDPQDVKVSTINSTTIHVEWKPPKTKDQNGVIRGYHVHVQEIREEVSLLLYSQLEFLMSHSFISLKSFS